MTNQPARKEPEHIGAIVDRLITNIPRPNVPDDTPRSHPTLGTPDHQHVYTNEDGEPVATVFRYDNSDKSAKKDFRPYCHYCQRWHGPDMRPLYYAKALKDIDGPVVMVEGEKCADALNALGILATTVFGSSGGIGKADFSPLRDRDVIIWPDNDEPGMKFANGIALSLREVGAATVGVVPFDALRENPKGWDVADAIADGWSVDQLLRLINSAEPLKANEALRLSEPLKGNDPLKETALRDAHSFKEPANDHSNTSASFKEDLPFKEHPLKAPGPIDLELDTPEHEWKEPDMSVLNPRPKPPEFPTYLFGPFWAKWISRQAKGKSAPEDYVGAALLVAASTAIGNSRWVSPWASWREPPHLWAALVGNPSSGKSPAIDPAIELIRKIEAEDAEGHVEALRQYDADKIAAKYKYDEWEKDVKAAAKEGYSPPLKPEAAIEPLKPMRPRLRVSDATPEALMNVIAAQPKGVMMTRDELAGWLGSFNRYSGGEGGDRAFWLEAWGGRSYVIDRVKNGEPVTIPHLSVSVLGGIQPDKLASTLLKGDDDGLTARFIYFWPNPVPLERPDDVLDSIDALKAFRGLHGLEMGTDEHGNAVPITISLTEEAANFFQDWRVQHRDNEPEGALLSWWGKMPGVCLRLAITFEGLWNAPDGKGLDQVGKQAVEAATVMIDEYLKPMAKRAFGDNALSDHGLNASILAKWLLKYKPVTINTRRLQREARLPGLRDASAIHDAIALLVGADWLRPDNKRQGDTPGRSSNDYIINGSLMNRAF